MPANPVEKTAWVSAVERLAHRWFGTGLSFSHYGTRGPVLAARVGGFRIGRAGVIAGLAVFTAFSSPAQEKTPPGEVCQTCHEEIVKAYPTRRHASQECTACHGQADKHAESADPADIRNPAKLSARATDQTCLTCHRNQPSRQGRILSGHARSQTSCLSCHGIHSAFEGKRAHQAINAQCASCHAGASAEFQKPHRHAVAQGGMACTSCHNPHGQPLARAARLSFNEPGCLNCHGDKRGPFVFEHAPIRQAGCTSCHEPHGSANPRMLTRPEVRQLCLECHSGIGAARDTVGGVPPAFHDLRSARYRNCTTCHVKVHGSHVNRAFLR